MAADLATTLSSRIHLVRTYDPMTSLAGGAAALAEAGTTASQLIEEQDRIERDECESYLSASARGLAEEGLDVESVTLRATPVDGLKSVIEGLADVIVVMTSRGRGGLQRFVLGSVADGLLHSVEVPIMVIPSLAQTRSTGQR